MLTEQVQLPYGEVGGHGLFHVVNGVLDVEPDDSAGGELVERAMGEYGEALEDELVIVVVDDGGRLHEEVGGRRDGNAVMVESIGVVCFWVTLYQQLLASIDPVSYTRFLGSL